MRHKPPLALVNVLQGCCLEFFSGAGGSSAGFRGTIQWPTPSRLQRYHLTATNQHAAEQTSASSAEIFDRSADAGHRFHHELLSRRP